jgi:peptidoglycan hydrolase CwlO-like protein
MKITHKIVIVSLTFLSVIGSSFVPSIYAQTATSTPTATVTPTNNPTPTNTPAPTQAQSTPTPTPTPDNSGAVKDLQNQISDLQTKITDLQGQEKTLSNQIEVMDSQIKLTQYKIASTKEQIEILKNSITITNTKISQINTSFSDLAKALVSRIKVKYENSHVSPIEVMASTNSIADLMKKTSYLQIVQNRDKELLYQMQTTKDIYANQKTVLEDKHKKVLALQTDLEGLNKDLTSQQDSKKSLLAQTQGNESSYQTLLARAQAQLAGFSNFVATHGGASLLSNQTVCDDWGCYYNQRDTQWGAMALNHTQYSLASDGCLLTDMAMVMTHYGHRNVNPITINSNPQNFASYEPAWLNKTIFADGVSATRISTAIDAELSSGRPVIVGISYDSGPLADHFVTLISGSGGSYQMNDPYLPNGHNISFNAHYSTGSIREIERITVQ